MTPFDIIICMAVILGLFIALYPIADAVESYIRQKRWEEEENKLIEQGFYNYKLAKEGVDTVENKAKHQTYNLAAQFLRGSKLPNV